MQSRGPNGNRQILILPEWKDQINELTVEHISSLKEKILNDPNMKDTLRRLHDDFVLVSADKAANNLIVVHKKYYTQEERCK